MQYHIFAIFQESEKQMLKKLKKLMLLRMVSNLDYYLEVFVIKIYIFDIYVIFFVDI